MASLKVERLTLTRDPRGDPTCYSASTLYSPAPQQCALATRPPGYRNPIKCVGPSPAMSFTVITRRAYTMYVTTNVATPSLEQSSRAGRRAKPSHPVDSGRLGAISLPRVPRSRSDLTSDGFHTSVHTSTPAAPRPRDPKTLGTFHCASRRCEPVLQTCAP